MSLNYERVIASLARHRQTLVAHKLYGQIKCYPTLRNFMKNHSYAVWDFMSLMKSFQFHISGNKFPWVPPKDVQALRFVSEITMEEECDDVCENKSYISHYDLYVNGMKEVKAFSEPIEQLVQSLSEDGVDWRHILEANRKRYEGLVHPLTYKFVTRTLEVASTGKKHEVAAYFLFGREDPIPDMFRKLVKMVETSKTSAPNFMCYLDRHIKVDEGNHAPQAERLIRRMCGDDQKVWEDVLRFGKEAIEQRIKLWDGVLADLHRPATCYEQIGGMKVIKKSAERMFFDPELTSCFEGARPEDAQSYLFNFFCKVIGSENLALPNGEINVAMDELQLERVRKHIQQTLVEQKMKPEEIQQVFADGSQSQYLSN